MNQEKTESVTALELAKLAALIDPETCRTGNARDALLGAMALFEESSTLCDELGAKNLPERLDWLMENADSVSSGGASRLYRVYSDRILSVPAPTLTLATSNDAPDTLRPYLHRNGKLEGRKPGRKAWSQVRTVRDNLRLMIVDRCNRSNKANADQIQAKELRDAEEARKQGCTVEELHARGHAYYDNELWRDGEAEFEKLMKSYAVIEGGKLVHYAIPQDTVDMFIKWKRETRQKGGVKKIRQLTRKEVFGMAVKKNIPKKVK